MDNKYQDSNGGGVMTIDSKEKILNIAFEIFVNKGYQGTSLNDIAKESGLTKGGIYHYFESKEDLYYQVLAKFFDSKCIPNWLKNAHGNIKDIIKNGFESIMKEKVHIQELVGSNNDDAILHFHTFLYEATRKYPIFQKKIDRDDEEKIRILAEAFQRAGENGEIRRDVDPQMMAFELDALLQQLKYLSFVNPGIKEDKEMFKKLFENYWLRLEP